MRRSLLDSHALTGLLLLHSMLVVMPNVLFWLRLERLSAGRGTEVVSLA